MDETRTERNQRYKMIHDALFNDTTDDLDMLDNDMLLEFADRENSSYAENEYSMEEEPIGFCGRFFFCFRSKDKKAKTASRFKEDKIDLISDPSILNISSVQKNFKNRFSHISDDSLKKTDSFDIQLSGRSDMVNSVIEDKNQHFDHNSRKQNFNYHNKNNGLSYSNSQKLGYNKKGKILHSDSINQIVTDKYSNRNDMEVIYGKYKEALKDQQIINNELKKLKEEYLTLKNKSEIIEIDNKTLKSNNENLKAMYSSACEKNALMAEDNDKTISVLNDRIEELEKIIEDQAIQNSKSINDMNAQLKRFLLPALENISLHEDLNGIYTLLNDSLISNQNKSIKNDGKSNNAKQSKENKNFNTKSNNSGTILDNLNNNNINLLDKNNDIESSDENKCIKIFNQNHNSDSNEENDEQNSNSSDKIDLNNKMCSTPTNEEEQVYFDLLEQIKQQYGSAESILGEYNQFKQDCQQIESIINNCNSTSSLDTDSYDSNKFISLSGSESTNDSFINDSNNYISNISSVSSDTLDSNSDNFENN